MSCKNQRLLLVLQLSPSEEGIAKNIDFSKIGMLPKLTW